MLFSACIHAWFYSYIASIYYDLTPVPHSLGLHFIHLETQTLNQSEVNQTIILKQFGFKVHFPPYTFLEPANITVGVFLSGNFVPPTNTSLISALYYIKTSSELLQPARVEIEHCVNADWDHYDVNNTLTFGKANALSDSSHLHVFEKLSGGTFSRNSWGVIELSSFSVIGVFGNETVTASSIDYLAYLLRVRHKSRPEVYIYDVSIVTSRKLNAIKEVTIHLNGRMVHIASLY